MKRIQQEILLWRHNFINNSLYLQPANQWKLNLIYLEMASYLFQFLKKHNKISLWILLKFREIVTIYQQLTYCLQISKF